MTAPDLTTAVERVRAEMALVRDCTVCDGDGTVQRHDPPYGQRRCGGCQGTGTRPVMGNNVLRDALTTILSELDRLSAALGEIASWPRVTSYPNTYRGGFDAATTIAGDRARTALQQTEARDGRE